MIALASDTPAIRRPDPAERAADAALALRLRAILTVRRAGASKDCDCPHCLPIKVAPFRCADCGFTGEPYTYPCTCCDNLVNAIAGNEVLLQTYPDGAGWPAHYEASWADVRRDQSALERLATTVLPPCAGDGRGMPPTGAVMFGFEGSCGHGLTCCPACDSPGDGECTESLVLAMLREVNSAVAAELPVDGSDARQLLQHRDELHRRRENAVVERKVGELGEDETEFLSSFVPVGIDSIAAEVSIVCTPTSADPCLTITVPGALDTAICGTLPVEQIEWLGTQLLAIVARARADGLLVSGGAA